MVKQDVKTSRVIRNGKLAMKLEWYRNNVLEDVTYIDDPNLIY